MARTSRFVGQSLGSIVGSVFLSLDPNVGIGVINVPGGGIARLLDGSPTFGPRIRAGLAAAGVEAGTPDYDAFMVAAQTAVDSGDPINFGGADTLMSTKRLLAQEVVGGGDVLPDQVIPNTVPGAPLSGTEPLIARVRARRDLEHDAGRRTASAAPCASCRASTARSSIRPISRPRPWRCRARWRACSSAAARVVQVNNPRYVAATAAVTATSCAVRRHCMARRVTSCACVRAPALHRQVHCRAS